MSFGPTKGWRAGISTTVSNSFTQTATSKSSVQVMKCTARGDRSYGPSNSYVGINHDYDIVWVWLNPIELFTANTDTANHTTWVVWNGFGYSELDQPAMDIYPAYVGWLNGDIAMTPSQAAPLKRAWAAGELWPSGTGPALTGPGPGTDFENIAKTDPYWQCTSKPASCPTAVDSTRFTLTTNQDFLYLQAPLGGQPITQTYTDSYAITNTIAQGASSATTQTFATESTFGTSSAFWISFKSTLATTNSWTTTNGWDSSLATMNGSSAFLSITGPPCNVVGNTCSPVYNKSTQFDLYEDNLFGTFFLNPVN